MVVTASALVSHGHRHAIELNRAPIEWNLDHGSVHFFGRSTVMFWTDPSMLRLLAPLVEEIGVPLYQILVAHSSSHGTDEDYHQMVTSLGDTFEAGFLAWGEAVSVAGWGRFELPVFDPVLGRAEVVIHNPWELEMQRNLPPERRWGCPFLMGKIIGLFTHALGTTCWADETLHVAADDQRVTFSVYPSVRTIPAELETLRRERMQERERQLEHRVDERTHELRQTHARLVQAERIALLGQLVAGVAHEINNPLGAIQASTHGVQAALVGLPAAFVELQALCGGTGAHALAIGLSEHMNRRREFLGFRERRTLRDQHQAHLEAAGVEQADAVAEALVHLGIHEPPDRWLPLLCHPRALEILDIVGRFAIVAEGVADVSQAAARASKIVDSLSRYNHRDSEGRPTWGRIQEGLETVLTLYHHMLKDGVEVECEFEVLPPLLAFHDELNQVWTNLIQNAVHAMEGRGRLRLRIHADGAWQHVSILDTGEGIPEAVKARIFEPFFTTKPAGQGTGLGLAISQQIVSKHGGTLALDSTLGVGTLVRVALPVRAQDDRWE